MPTLQYDGLITIATGSSRRSASWKTKEMLWSEFVDKLGRVTRTQETQQEYFRMPKEERDNAKDVGGFVGGTPAVKLTPFYSVGLSPSTWTLLRPAKTLGLRSS